MLRTKTFDFLVKGTSVKLNLYFTQLEDWAERFEGKDWTRLDEKRLADLFQKTDESIEEISKTLGRSVKSVEEKLTEKYGPDVLKKP